jgi:hypothetical protein
MRMRFLLLLVVIAAAAFPTAAEKNDLLKMLPDEKTLVGWRQRPDTLLYVQGEHLSDMYSASADWYRGKGLVEAIQLVYEHQRDLLVVTINAFDSKEKAQAMFKSWTKQAERRKVLRPLPLGDGAGVTPESIGAIGYLLVGSYLVKAQVTTKGDGGSNQVARALYVISRLAADATPSRDERR